MSDVMNKRMKEKEITVPARALAEALVYDHKTGQIKWKARPGEHFQTQRAASSWNSRNAGQPAFDRPNRCGHFEGQIFSRRFLSHRVAWALYYDDWPEGFVDHIDGNPKNNRISNLRCVSHKENSRNSKRSRANTTGETGVVRVGGEYRAEIRVDGEKHYLGRYPTVDSAAAARRLANQKFGFHQNHGRQP